MVINLTQKVSPLNKILGADADLQRLAIVVGSRSTTESQRAQRPRTWNLINRHRGNRDRGCLLDFDDPANTDSLAVDQIAMAEGKPTRFPTSSSSSSHLKHRAAVAAIMNSVSSVPLCFQSSHNRIPVMPNNAQTLRLMTQRLGLMINFMKSSL